MKKIDLRKELKHLYAPSAREVAMVKVPKFNFIMLDGKIQPGETPATSREFQEGIGALYGASFTLKFMSKSRKRNAIDHTLLALEGLWWTEAGDFDFNAQEERKWTLMIMQPQHITTSMFQQALRQLQQKRGDPALSKLRFEPFREGLCIQIMHVGPYSEEPQTIERMKAFAQENGYCLRGKHHEIYLGNPRRAKPERLRTILRHPVMKRA